MISTVAQTTSLPMGALWFMFFVTAAWTIYQFITVIWRALKSAVLHVQLTTKCFWRLTEDGEVLFPQCVMYSSNGACHIQEIEFCMTRQGEGSGKKLFPLRLENVGVIKQEQSKPLGEFHFHTSSPIHFMGSDQEEHPVYRCTLDEFDARIVKAAEDFRTKVQDFSSSVKSRREGAGEVSDSFQEKVVEEFKQIVNEATRVVMETIQMDEGTYQLEIKVRYLGKKGLTWSSLKTTTSSIEFVFGPDFRDITRTNVERCLATLGRVVVRQEYEDVPYPEYYPKPKVSVRHG